jgi:hypothetical protein
MGWRNFSKTAEKKFRAAGVLAAGSDVKNVWDLHQEGKKIKLSVCLCVCLCVCVSVCVNEIPTLIFYMRTLSDVSS